MSCKGNAQTARASPKPRAPRASRDGEGAGRTTASLSFHSLRHTFISALANAGVASDLRQRLSGHSDDKTHQGYTHHDDAIMRAAIGSLPAVGGAK